VDLLYGRCHELNRGGEIALDDVQLAFEERGAERRPVAARAPFR
jgi:hypothetical protein